MCKDAKHRIATMERIQTYVEVTPTCWEWTGHRNRDGYGMVKVWDASRGRFASRLVPRVVWEIHNGPLPDGQEICHSCDNRACARVSHLFLGTHVENVADATAKGRNRGYRWDPAKVRSGENHARAKLTAGQVAEIRAALTGKPPRGTQSRLARQYGVTVALISRIKLGLAWNHE